MKSFEVKIFQYLKGDLGEQLNDIGSHIDALSKCILKELNARQSTVEDNCEYRIQSVLDDLQQQRLKWEDQLNKYEYKVSLNDFFPIL